MSAVDDADTPWRSHKNTRRWCRGKPGVVHVIERQEGVYGFGRVTACRWITSKNDPDWRWTVCTEADVCVNCGKRFTLDRSECHLVKAETTS